MCGKLPDICLQHLLFCYSVAIWNLDVTFITNANSKNVARDSKRCAIKGSVIDDHMFRIANIWILQMSGSLVDGW